MTISENDWRGFEILAFRIVREMFNLPEDKNTRLTRKRKDGGFDAIFQIPYVHADDAESMCAIMEAKLRNSFKRDLPLQDFSKSIIIAVNRTADLLILATNLRLSEETISQLRQYAAITGLQIKWLSISQISEQLEKEPELKSLCTDSLLSLLNKSYQAFAVRGEPAKRSVHLLLNPSTISELTAPPELLSQTHKNDARGIADYLSVNKGLYIVSGAAGTGKSYFVREVLYRLRLKQFQTTKIDIKNCPTSRTLFMEIARAFWHLSDEMVQSLSSQDFLQAIDYLGERKIPESLKKSVASAFNKGKRSYIKYSDIFQRDMVEYLYLLYDQTRKMGDYVICFTNVNYATKDVFDFLLSFLKRFDTKSRYIVELRSSLYIDHFMQPDDWSQCVHELQLLSMRLNEYRLPELSSDDLKRYINRLISPTEIDLSETNIIVDKVGPNPLLVNAFVTYLNKMAFVDIPKELRKSYIETVPIDGGAQIIPALIDTLSKEDEYYGALFFLAYILNGEVPLNIIEYISSSQPQKLERLLRDTDIFRLSNETIRVTHALYLDYFSSLRYIALVYQQTLAKKMLSRDFQKRLKLKHDDKQIYLIRLNDILCNVKKTAELSLKFGKNLFFGGQYALSQTYIQKANEKFSSLVRNEADFAVPRIEAKIILLKNELYLHEKVRHELEEIIRQISEIFSCLTDKAGKTPECDALYLQYCLVQMRLYHYWGEYHTSYNIIHDAIERIENTSPRELVGDIWTEYAIATKELESLSACLKQFRKGRKACPNYLPLLYSNFTHLSEKYSTMNVALAMRSLRYIDTFKDQLPLSSILHHEINVSTMKMYGGDYDDAMREGTDIIARANQSGLKNEEARCSNLIGCLFYIRDDLSKAENRLKHGIGLIPRHQHITVLWPLKMNLLSVLVSSKKWEDALEVVTDCCDILCSSYVDRINSLTIHEKKYPKLFAGLLIAFGNLCRIERHIDNKDCLDKLIDRLRISFRIPELNGYFEKIRSDIGALETLFEGTPFLHRGKLVIKS